MKPKTNPDDEILDKWSMKERHWIREDLNHRLIILKSLLKEAKRQTAEELKWFILKVTNYEKFFDYGIVDDFATIILREIEQKYLQNQEEKK